MLNDVSYALALNQSGLSGPTLTRLVGDLGSSEALWNASEHVIRPYLKGELMAQKQLEKLMAAKTTYDPERLAQSYQAMGIEVVTQDMPEFPVLLRQIHDPPFLLYVRGNLQALGERSLAMVGTRRFTDTGRYSVEMLIEQLKPYHPCIVSGLAEGVDTLCHQEALHHGLPTVAVFGTGIDKIFPSQNHKLAQRILESGGALISEYPLGVSGDRYTFPKRNRIIAGLTQGTLVVEGDIKSGSLITARCALRENREVMAIPGSLTNPMSIGPNTLIQQGAKLVQHGEDIAECLGWKPEKQAKASSVRAEQSVDALAQLSALEQSVYAMIGYEPTAFDRIHDQNQGVTVMDLTTTLTMLELYGLVTALPGSRYSRNAGASVVEQEARSTPPA